MRVFELPFTGIPFDADDVYRGMGSDGYVPDADMCTRVKRVTDVVSSFCRPLFGYEIFPAGTIGSRDVSVDNVSFSTGSVITPFFVGAQSFAVFVATCGAEFDDWLQRQKNSGDILDQFVADAVGSEIAEAAARAMLLQLAGETACSGMRISNSYSPGYCGWHIREQRQLFSLLPPAPCGITLNDSCLMLPIKSVSGLIAIGADVEKHPYACSICGRKECYKKRARI